MRVRALSCVASVLAIAVASAVRCNAQAPPAEMRPTLAAGPLVRAPALYDPPLTFEWLSISAALRDSVPPRQTTLLERFLWGLAGGATAVGLAATVRSLDWLPAAAYPVGSAAGVLLVTHAREGSRPLRVVVGTFVGALPALVCVAFCTPNPEGPDAQILWGLTAVVTIPLGSAMGHSTSH